MSAQSPSGASRRVLCAVGTRPNFIKVAPILAAFAERSPAIDVTLLHTGQHYGHNMDEQYFDELDMPAPDFNLEVGSGSHAWQTAEIMRRFEPVLDAVAPDAVIVAGDGNSTLACALVAQKKAIPLVHVEAGLRSFDRSMPEETNRILTDHMSDLLLTSEPAGEINLLREGIPNERIHCVGNVMIDSLLLHAAHAVPVKDLLRRAGRSDLLGEDRSYALLTLHRPANVDDLSSLCHSLQLVHAIARRLPVILPLHPRTRAMVEKFGLQARLDHPAVMVTEPLSYHELLGALKSARVAITDSGGLQEEALMLGVPCITLRDTTERPVTVECGGNVVAGREPAHVLQVLAEVLRGQHKPQRKPHYWDGHAAERIVAHVQDWLRQPAQH